MLEPGIENYIEELQDRIIALDVWHVALPVVSRRDHGIGTVADKMEVVVLRLTTESGVTGHGEASPWSVFTGTPEASYAAINRYFRPLVVNARVADFESIMAKLEKIVIHCTEAKAAMEMAWLDVVGKLVGKPVWALLGKQCRQEIPLSVSLANPDFDQDLQLLSRLQEDGVGIVKLKTGFRDDQFDEMRVSTIRKKFPDFKLRIDYNQGLESSTALASVAKLDVYQPDFIEQPVAAHDFDSMARIRKTISAPLLADESVFSPQDMRRAIKEEICDGVSIKIMKSSGIRHGLTIAEIAASAKLPAYGGDMFETGLAHMAGIHMISVAANISLGCEFYHAKYYLVDDILNEPLPIEQGSLLVPNKPGLGVEVNEDVLNKYSVGNQ